MCGFTHTHTHKRIVESISFTRDETKREGDKGRREDGDGTIATLIPSLSDEETGRVGGRARRKEGRKEGDKSDRVAREKRRRRRKKGLVGESVRKKRDTGLILASHGRGKVYEGEGCARLPHPFVSL